MDNIALLDVKFITFKYNDNEIIFTVCHNIKQVFCFKDIKIQNMWKYVEQAFHGM
jgi:hypothetical protein